MAFSMTIRNLSIKGENLLEWKQLGERIEINVFEMLKFEENKKLSNLINELYSKNVMFSFRIQRDKKYLILYNFYPEKSNSKKKKNLVSHLFSTYSLKIPTNVESLFIPSIKKIEQENSMLKFTFEDSSKIYFLAFQLSSIDSTGISFRRLFTKYIRSLIQAEIFEVIISHIPSVKNKNLSSKWGMMFIAQCNNKESIQKKYQNFIRFLKASSVKLNCKLISVSKKAATKHKSNVRLLVPWIKQSGSFFESIDIPALVRIWEEKKDDKLTETIVEECLKAPESRISTSEFQKKSISKPFQSIKSYSSAKVNQMKTKEQVVEVTSNNFNSKIPDVYNTGKLEDLAIPAPRTMNTVFDAEYLKVRISRIFKEFEFKETVIFEDIFDLVLRRGSFYIFVKIFKDILNQSHANKIVESLSSIAGLRNEFLCIVVTDIIEEGSTRTLNEFNILHLTLSDVLLDESIKTKIYNTILA